MTGTGTGSYSPDRKEEDLDAFADRCAAKGAPLEVFFPERGDNTKAAKRLCIPCPVRAQCLEYALTYNERFGIWAGYSETERRTIRRARKNAAAARAVNA